MLYTCCLVPICRGCLYVEGPEGRDWGWYSPQQIPSLIAWLETGSQQEQQLAEDLYAVYLPVLNIVKQPGQVSQHTPVFVACNIGAVSCRLRQAAVFALLVTLMTTALSVLLYALVVTLISTFSPVPMYALFVTLITNSFVSQAIVCRHQALSHHSCRSCGSLLPLLTPCLSPLRPSSNPGMVTKVMQLFNPITSTKAVSKC